VTDSVTTSFETKNGTRSTTRTTSKVNPMVKVANECQRQMTRLIGRLGLTPSDRAGLNVAEDPEDDELMKFLARRPGPRPPEPGPRPRKPSGPRNATRKPGGGPPMPA